MRSKFLCKTVVVKILFFLLFFTNISLYAQSNLITELSGDPLDLSEWTTNGVDIEGEEIVLTQAASDEKGALFYAQPYNLNQCVKWEIEFDFRIYDGLEHADGLAFWYLENPPENFGTGGDIGMPADSYGLKVVFDTYDNDNYDLINHNPNPEIQVYYGEGYSEENSVIPHDDMLLSYWPGLISSEYQRAVISWDNGYIKITIDGEEALAGDVEAFDGVENIAEGYFGFSASTGLYYDRHSIKNIKVYNNAVSFEEEFEFVACDENGEGFSTFDLTQIEDEIENDDDNFVFALYYLTEEDAIADSNVITDPENFVNDVEGGQTIYVRIENMEGCFSIAEIELVVEPVPTPDLEEVILSVCASEEEIEFDLTQAEEILFEDSSELNFLYFETEENAENEEGEIQNTEGYLTAEETTVYVKIYASNEECFAIFPIHLQFEDPPLIGNIEDIEVCGNEIFTFDLTQNENIIIDTQENVEVRYFETEENAILGENAIGNPEEYNTSTIGCETIFVRLELETDSDCFSIADFQVCGFEIEIENPESLMACEIDFFGDLVVFDLTENTDEILANQNSTDFQVYFYNSAEDAEIGENEILFPENYETDQNENIYFKVETSEGCFAIGNFELIIIETSITKLENVEVCENEKINLLEIASDENITEIDFYASLEDVAEDRNISSPEEYEMDSAVEKIYIKAAGEDCVGLYEIELIQEECELFIPEGFSPNGDGINDQFIISGIDTHAYSLKIYSRYGILLYKGNQDSAFWDGTSKKGNKVPSGTYYYILKSDKIKETLKGWVYLNR